LFQGFSTLAMLTFGGIQFFVKGSFPKYRNILNSISDSTH
jgi:hypothetical protein